MKALSMMCLMLLFSEEISAQTYQWNATPSPAVSYRYEDVYFLNDDTGFAVHYAYIDPGFVVRTDDGGLTWTKVLDSVPFTFRDIGFTDDLHGWIGTYQQSGVGADTSVMYATTDGGFTWLPVSNFPGPTNAGICGMCVIDDSTICGVGRYSGPCGFYKTINNGLTWSYTDLSSLADGLVDVYFASRDTGFAVGYSGPSYSTGFGRILYTTDGGISWSIQYTTPNQYSMCWKISFPSRNVGYVSMQMWNSAVRHFLKTTDGGITWSTLPYPGGPPPTLNIQGIGFINDTTGWVSGQSTYFTQNGGLTWTFWPGLGYGNRYRFLSDSVAYCAGYFIYKLEVNGVGIHDPEPSTQIRSYPNPASSQGYLEFYTYRTGPVRLAVLDANGREVKVLIDETLVQGNQHFIWSTAGLPAGAYFYELYCDGKYSREQFIIAR